MLPCVEVLATMIALEFKLHLHLAPPCWDKTDIQSQILVSKRLRNSLPVINDNKAAQIFITIEIKTMLLLSK
jgi:hypothetical protein